MVNVIDENTKTQGLFVLVNLSAYKKAIVTEFT